MPRPTDDRLMWEAHKKNQEELIDEGIWDRINARGAAAKQAGVGGTLKALGQKALGGVLSKAGAPKAGAELTAAGISKGFDAKTMSILNSHVQKLEAQIADLNNDIEKLGLNNPEVQKDHPEVSTAITALTTQLKHLKTSISPTGAVGKRGVAAGDYAGGTTTSKRGVLNPRRYTPKWAGGGELKQNTTVTPKGSPPPPPTP